MSFDAKGDAMTLQEKLDTMREASRARIPPEAQAIMRRGIDDLRASVRNAERGCFVMQALQHPVPVTGRTLLNGAVLAE